MHNDSGFTLIEIFIALVIITVAFMALMKASIFDILTVQRLKDKMISHWVASQGITMIKLHLLSQPLYQETTHKTKMFNQTWYWRAQIIPISLASIYKIKITVSKYPTGRFSEPLIDYQIK